MAAPVQNAMTGGQTQCLLVASSMPGGMRTTVPPLHPKQRCCLGLSKFTVDGESPAYQTDNVAAFSITARRAAAAAAAAPDLAVKALNTSPHKPQASFPRQQQHPTGMPIQQRVVLLLLPQCTLCAAGAGAGAAAALASCLPCPQKHAPSG
jgi:hypothetical protein